MTDFPAWLAPSALELPSGTAREPHILGKDEPSGRSDEELERKRAAHERDKEAINERRRAAYRKDPLPQLSRMRDYRDFLRATGLWDASRAAKASA